MGGIAMRLPHLNLPNLTRIPLHLGGLAPVHRAAEGNLSYMENLITEQGVTATRAPRAILASPQSGHGMTVVRTAGGEMLCYVDGRELVVGETRYPLELSDDEHRLIPFGDKVLIFPERKYLSLSDGASGALEAVMTTSASTLFTLCRPDGSPYTPLSTSPTAPTSPAHGDFWLDTTSCPPILRCYSAAREEWQTVSNSCLRLSSPGLGAAFRPGDAVRLAGIAPTELRALSGIHRLVDCGEDHLVISAPPTVTLRQHAPLRVTRTLPELDPTTLIVWDDRLLGAAKGLDENGTPITLLCACRRGDPFNWEVIDPNDAEDARRWTLATAEPITAAVVYGGLPHFFTEHGLLRLSGYGVTARWQQIPLEGVMSGCGESLREAGNTLYYRARRAMMSYDGKHATPLPPLPWDSCPRVAAAGVLGTRYVLSLTEEDGRAHLLVFDTADRLWSRLDNTRAVTFSSYGNGLCYRDGCDGTVCLLEGDTEGTTRWIAETAPIRAWDDRGRLIRLELTLTLIPDGEAEILIGYDGAAPREHLATVTGNGPQPMTVTLHPRSADHITLRLQGHGKAILHTLCKILR